MRTLNFLPYLIAVIPPLVGAGNFVLARAMHSDCPPVALLFWRWICALLIMIIIAMPKLKNHFEIIFKNWKILTLISLPNIVLFNFFMYSAANYTQAINMSILANLFPLFLLINLAIFYKQKISNVQIFSVLIALIGSVLVIAGGRDFTQLLKMSGLIGDLLAVCGAITFSFSGITLKYKPRDLNNTTFLLGIIFFGTIIILPFYLIEHFFYKQAEFSSALVFTVLYLGLFASVIGLYTWNYAIQKLGTVTPSLIFYLAPFFNICLAVPLLSEKFTHFHFIGLMIIILGINLKFVTSILSKRT